MDSIGNVDTINDKWSHVRQPQLLFSHEKGTGTKFASLREKRKGTHLWKCGSAGTVINSGASSMASKNSLSSSSSLASPFPVAAGPSRENGIKTKQTQVLKLTRHYQT